jgi:hypothetical protein
MEWNPVSLFINLLSQIFQTSVFLLYTFCNLGRNIRTVKSKKNNCTEGHVDVLVSVIYNPCLIRHIWNALNSSGIPNLPNQILYCTHNSMLCRLENVISGKPGTSL